MNVLVSFRILHVSVHERRNCHDDVFFDIENVIMSSSFAIFVVYV